jgi:pimeloyl-ACP methyl ester carboxylesterase
MATDRGRRRAYAPAVALPQPDDDEDAAGSYPGASAPHRSRVVDSSGLRLMVHEWGEPDGAPILFAHGGFDFARTYDVFAPLLAAQGWRVVAWDQRGHGDSQHAALYNWEADVRDGLAVLDTVTGDPLPVLGHSKGGGLMLQLADACPHRVRAVVNLDGLPSRRRSPDVPDHERTRLLAGELAGWLDHRRALTGKSRKPGTLDELARRRARMNPRLPLDWLRYLVTAGARRDPDGWRWKIDPTMRFGGFGPWRPEWSMLRLPGLGMPFFGLLGLEPEEMGWGSAPADVQKYLPPGARFEALAGVGHFLHIERPHEVAAMVLDFLGPAR